MYYVLCTIVHRIARTFHAPSISIRVSKEVPWLLLTVHIQYKQDIRSSTCSVKCRTFHEPVLCSGLRAVVVGRVMNAKPVRMLYVDKYCQVLLGIAYR